MFFSCIQHNLTYEAYQYTVDSHGKVAFHLVFCVLVSIKYLNKRTNYLKTYEYNDYDNSWCNEERCSIAEEDKSADDRTQGIDEARYVLKHSAVN